MLMTVLKGELAVKQSRALIRTFKQMKDYIVDNQDLIGRREFLQLSMQITHGLQAVSYTHLDVYKRQEQYRAEHDKLKRPQRQIVLGQDQDIRDAQHELAQRIPRAYFRTAVSAFTPKKKPAKQRNQIKRPQPVSA